MLVARWLGLGGVAWLLLATPLAAQATPSASSQREGVTLREYIDIRFNALEAKIAALDAARQLAIDKAEVQVNNRLEGMNEFRSQLKDQAATFATKEEVDKQTELVSARLAAIDNRFASMDGSFKAFWLVFVLAQVAMAWWLNRSRAKAAA